jgi:soluble lytic murein transglycosylase-like protein
VLVLLAGVVLVTGSGCGLSADQDGRAREVSVPSEYRGYFTVAARRCPAVLTPAALAAQAHVESRFRSDAVSSAGAEGLMQITPATWARFGTDADGDGRADPFSAADSVATSAKINCSYSRSVAGLPGDRLDLRLAAYNAGVEAVRQYRGVPPYPETQDYIRLVRGYTQRFERQLS